MLKLSTPDMHDQTPQDAGPSQADGKLPAESHATTLRLRLPSTLILSQSAEAGLRPGCGRIVAPRKNMCARGPVTDRPCGAFRMQFQCDGGKIALAGATPPDEAEHMQATEVQVPFSDQEAPDAAARGILFAVLLSSVFWVALALIVFRLRG